MEFNQDIKNSGGNMYRAVLAGEKEAASVQRPYAYALFPKS